MILTVIVLYLAVVLSVGLLAHRRSRGTGEDFYVASRSIGPFILLMTLFGTNMTAFSILGASGEAYREGVLVYALMGSSSALIVPLVFYFVGTRMWWLGKRHGYLTQVQFFRDRYGSEALAVGLFAVLVILLLPYVLIGVKGGGDALAAVTGGPGVGLPSWVGSLAVCSVIFIYVTFGGMRSTAWVNTFQTTVFMVVGAVAFLVITRSYGGLAEAMEQVRRSVPQLVMVGQDRHTLLTMASYLLVPLSVGVFPHIFSHWLSADHAKSFKTTIVLYPLCIVVVWVPSVALGVIGNIDHPQPFAGPILVQLILENSGGVLAGLLAAGIFAAIMSSLDSQTLAVGTMFTQDIVRPYAFGGELPEQKQVLYSRIFIVLFLAAAFVISQITTRSIFSLGVWSLSGYAGLFPLVVAALYWRRSSATGALAALVTTAVLWTVLLVRSQSVEGVYTIAGSGVMPVVLIVAGSVTALVIGSLARPALDPAAVERFFPPAGRKSREIGLRMALGAPKAGISKLVLGQGLRPAGWGLAMGFVLAYLPARRASRIDPVAALRAE
ncbi:MAG: sodium:solute symporter family protein [Gemmatimonadetes bacterium]|nr:sodium:solute symporter family protein [Gemmatimonadota bacterium]